MDYQQAKQLWNKLSEQFNGNELDSLSSIERDILLADLRALYELIKEEGSRAKTIAHTETLIPQKETRIEPPPLDEHQVIEPPREEETPTISFELKANKTLVPAPKEVNQSSINEKVLATKGSINEQLKANNTTKELHQQAASNDLKELIDLNKKYVFINGLFANNADEFNAAIEALNKVETAQQAGEYIAANLQPKYNWDNTNQVVRLFSKIVLSRFEG